MSPTISISPWRQPKISSGWLSEGTSFATAFPFLVMVTGSRVLCTWSMIFKQRALKYPAATVFITTPVDYGHIIMTDRRAKSDLIVSANFRGFSSRAGLLMNGTDGHFLCDLHPDLLRELLECWNLIEPQTNLFLQRVSGVHGRGPVPYGAACLQRRRCVEALGDDHTVVGPVLDDHRTFLSQNLRARDRAVCSTACGGRLRGCSLIAQRDRARVEARETLGGLRRLPSRNVQEREICRGCGRIACCFVFVCATILATTVGHV